jgi:hypothetical protein
VNEDVTSWCHPGYKLRGKCNALQILPIHTLTDRSVEVAGDIQLGADGGLVWCGWREQSADRQRDGHAA